MSNEGDRAAVFRTTKVRTKLKGDASWLQQRSEPEDENGEEKPWIAEVRASRVDGAPVETSPVLSPTTSTNTERPPTSGFLIRGVFTKLDKPTSSSTSNGFSGTTQFTKKPSESYKRIAPHTVRSTSENPAGTLSLEEQEKRRETASNVLKKSAVKQRSYVLSAAKIYESKEKAPDTSLVNSSSSFVAKRVEITDDDDESVATPAPVVTPPPSPVVPVASVASAPEPKPRKLVDTSVKTAVDVTVNEPVAPKVVEAAPKPVKEEPPPVSVTEKDPFEDMKPGCTKVATPLPELIPEYVRAVCTDLEPDDSEVSGTPLVKLTPASPTPVSLTPATPVPATRAPATPAPATRAPATRAPATRASATPAPATPAPATRVPATRVPATPASATPAPATDAPVTDAPVTPALATDAPATPAPATPVPATPVPATPVPATPVPATDAPATDAPATRVPATRVPATPAPATPAPATHAPVTDAPATPAPATPVPATPFPATPVPATPVPATDAPATDAPATRVPATRVPATPAPATPAPATHAPVTDAPETPAPTTAASVLPVPLSPAPVSAVKEDKVKTEPKPEPSPNPRSGVDTLTALSDTLISFDTSSTSSKDDEPALAEEEGGSADSHTEDGVEQEPTPALSNCEPITDDLLALSNGPEESAEPVPPSPGRWSQDLLGELDSLSTQREEEKQTDETAKETQSPTETVTITTKTVIISDKSSADPFDPYPIETTSPNSSSDLLQPLADISINSVSPTSTENNDPSPNTNMSGNALESLADDIIPINTGTTSTHRSWARTWETSPPQDTNTGESQKAAPEGQAEDQETLVKFERKSNDNDSPWDRWTSPTVYTITSTTDEEEEEEESPEDTQTVTTITSIRETRSELEPAMDRYETRDVMEEDRRVQTPEPENKKGFVYLKEYVNATEVSLHNARDTIDSGSNYLTSSSADYTYSSPSTYSSGSLSSTCTYCGELVGNDAKITIEHLNINCHPACFKCGVCGKPMGDLLYNMFLHGGKVHCESCYSKALD